jgi:hypothetical protein
MVPTDRPALIPVLTTHMLGEVTAIAQALPNDRIALQWDVCHEVIAWPGARHIDRRTLSGPAPAAWLSAIKSGPIALSPAIFPHTGPVFS